MARNKDRRRDYVGGQSGGFNKPGNAPPAVTGPDGKPMTGFPYCKVLATTWTDIQAGKYDARTAAVVVTELGKIKNDRTVVSANTGRYADLLLERLYVDFPSLNPSGAAKAAAQAPPPLPAASAAAKSAEPGKQVGEVDVGTLVTGAMNTLEEYSTQLADSIDVLKGCDANTEGLADMLKEGRVNLKKSRESIDAKTRNVESAIKGKTDGPAAEYRKKMGETILLEDELGHVMDALEKKLQARNYSTTTAAASAKAAEALYAIQIGAGTRKAQFQFKESTLPKKVGDFYRWLKDEKNIPDRRDREVVAEYLKLGAAGTITFLTGALSEQDDFKKAFLDYKGDSTAKEKAAQSGGGQTAPQQKAKVSQSSARQTGDQSSLERYVRMYIR